MLMKIGQVNGQSIILEKYIEQAKQSNLQIQDLKLKVQKQASRSDQVSTLWNPNINAQANYLFALGGRELVFPVGDLFNPTHGALNQLLGSEQFPTDLENNKIQLTPNNFIDASISISKPLINSTIKYNRLIQKAIEELAEEDILILQNVISKQLRTAYLNHLKTYKAIEVIDANIDLLRDVRLFNEKLVKYDKATTEVLSDVDFQLEDLKSQRASIIAQKNTTKAIVNLLLNRGLEEEVLIDTTLVGDDDQLMYSVQYNIEDAINNRREFSKIEKSKEVIELNQELIAKQGRPVVGIKGGVGVQAEEFSFDSGGPLYTLGLGMSMNIIDGGLRKKKVEELKIDDEIVNNQRELLRKSLELDLYKVKESITSLRSKYKADLSRQKSAQVSYDLVKIRYENNKALLIELLQAQNKMAVSEISKVITQFDILIMEAELDYIVGR